MLVTSMVIVLMFGVEDARSFYGPNFSQIYNLQYFMKSVHSSTLEKQHTSEVTAIFGTGFDRCVVLNF